MHRNVRTYIVVFLSVCLLASCDKPQPSKREFRLEGTISGIKENTVIYLRRKNIIDSCPVSINGKFHFIGTIQNLAESATLNIKDTHAITVVWLENKQILFSGNEGLTNVTITGSKTQLEADSLNKLTKALHLRQDSLTKAMVSKKADIDRNKYAKEIMQIDSATNDINLRYAQTNPNSLITVDLLQTYYTTWGKSRVQGIFNHMNANTRQLKAIKEVADYIRLSKNVEPGNIYADFIQYDISGKKVKLSDYVGKPILLEFWASWCAPCIRQNVELKKIYQQYHSKGLEIIAVTLDEDKNDWKSAIAKDHIPWLNVGEFGTPNQAVLTYSIYELPTSFIINKEGKIIRKQSGEQPIYDQISKLF